MSEPTAYPPLGCRGKLWHNDEIGSIKPSEVVYSFLDDPILFNADTPAFSHSACCKLNSCLYSNLYLVSVRDRSPGTDFSFEALRQPECYLALVDDEGDDPTWNVTKLWRVDFDTIPRDLLPPPGYRPLESS